MRTLLLIVLIGCLSLSANAQDSLNVSLLGSLPTPWQASGIAVQGGYAYVADGEDGDLLVVNISDPAIPVEVGAAEISEAALQVAVSGIYSYVAAAHSGLRVINVSVPQIPVEVGFCDTWDYASGISLQGDYAYIAADDEGMVIIDISEPTAPFEVSSIETEWWTQGITVEGDYAYVTDIYTGLYIFDISNVFEPVQLSVIDLPTHARGVKVVDDLAYVAARQGGLRIIDVSDPMTPVEVGFYDATDEAMYLDVVDGYVVMTDYQTGLLVLDCRIPSDPILVGYYDTPGEALDVMVVDKIAYLADTESLLILDCSDAIPSPITVSLTAPDPLIIPPGGGSFEYDISLVSNLLSFTYVDIWTGVLLPNGNMYGPIWFLNNIPITPNTVIDVTDLGQAVPAFAPMGLYTFWLKAGIYLGITFGMDSFIFQVIPTAAIEGDGAVEWTGSGQDRLLASTEKSSDVEQPPAEASLTSVYPNPFNPITTISVSLPEISELSVRVYNVTGQQVAELANGRISAGQHSFTFDGSNLASGLYFVRATVPGKLNAVQKIVLTK